MCVCVLGWVTVYVRNTHTFQISQSQESRATDQQYVGVPSQFIEILIIYIYIYICAPQRRVLRCRWSQRHTLCCQAPLAGLTVPLSVARRGQRCQRHARALCAMPDRHTMRLAGSAATYNCYLYVVSCVALFLLRVRFILSSLLGVFVCTFRLIGDALCAICSNLPHLPPTLPTHHKGGLNHLCASVFPRWGKGGEIVVQAAVTGVATTNTHKNTKLRAVPYDNINNNNKSRTDTQVLNRLSTTVKAQGFKYMQLSIVYVFLWNYSPEGVRAEQSSSSISVLKLQHYKKPIVRVRGQSHSDLVVFLRTKMDHG